MNAQGSHVSYLSMTRKEPKETEEMELNECTLSRNDV